MRVTVTDLPDPVVAWAELDKHLRLFGDTTEQAYAEACAAAATGHIDGPDGWLGRCIGVQELELRLDAFPCGQRAITLPYPPVVEIVSVIYIGDDGSEVTLDGDGYELLGRDLVPVYNTSWPTSVRCQREAVRVTYGAGYEEVPGAIVAAIKLMAGDLFGNRETVVTGTIAAAIPMSTTVERLLTPFRIYT